MFSITGYFFFGSNVDGRMITPQISDVPSRPFETNTSGARHPAFTSSLASAFSRSRITFASLVRPSCDTGARSMRDHVST